MARAVAFKPEEQNARSYVDRLILGKLSEMESVVKLGELADRLSSDGIGLATIRALLASNPERFAYHERKWIPAARLQGQGRPVAEAIALVLGRFGGPMPISLLAKEVALIRREDLDLVEPMVRRMVQDGRIFVCTQADEAFPLAWSFVAVDEPLARGLALNGVSEAEFADAQEKLAEINWRDAEAIEQALKVASPIRLKALGAVAWANLNKSNERTTLIYESNEFAAEALSIPGYVYSPDGTMHATADAKRWITTAIKLADRLVPTVEVEDINPIEIKPEDIDRLVARILGNEQSTTATRLLEEFFEITPGTKTFPDDLANVIASLRSNSSVQWVGGDRFRKLGDVPEYISEVPEPFQFQETDNIDEEGELVDVELTDEGLSSSLRKLLSHPLALDVLDEDVQPGPKNQAESVRLVLKSIHRELGTFPLAQLPTGWLEGQPKLQELILQDGSGRELQVWVNQSARLVYNLFDWWYEQPIESGAVFTLTKTSRANVLDFAWLDQPDPVVYISTQRMEELRRIGSESEGKSTLDLLVEVMAHWPKGADYLTILAEVNVVRRSSRRLVASLLSSYQCFYQRSGSPVWHFDPKKVELGFDKTKRKFIKK